MIASSAVYLPESEIEDLPAVPGFPQRSFEVNLLEALTRIAQRRWTVIKVAAICMSLGAVFCLLAPPRYTAVTRLLPPQQTQPATAMLMSQLANSGAGGALTSVAARQLGAKNQNDLYLGLLNSRPVADGLIQEFGLRRVYRSRDLTGARLTLAHFTNIVSEKNGFIALSVTDTDKQRAAEMANAYTDQLRKLMKDLAVTEASQRRLFYEEQLKQAKDALLSAEVALEQVQQRKGLIALDAQAKAMIEGIAAVHSQLAEKQVEIEALRSFSTDKNPNVQLAERQLAALRQEADRMEQSNPATSNPADLSLKDVPLAGLEFLRAEHEVKYRQAMFDVLMKQLDAARLDEAQEAAVIQVVEPAVEPERKTSPHRLQIMLLTLPLGILLGVLVALLPWCKEIFLTDPNRLLQLKTLRIAFKQAAL